MSDTHIKINAVTPKVQYTGNGSTVEFPYEFAIFDDSEMNVYLGDELQESGYTVSGAGETEGGNVTFTTAPANGTKITLIRNIPIERVTDFQEGGTFRPKNLNDEFDRQTAFLQQVDESLSRSVRVGPTSDISPEQVVAQVERVYDSIDNIDKVADDMEKIDDVIENIDTIEALADSAQYFEPIGENLSKIVTVADDLEGDNNIGTVVTNMSLISDVGGNISNINSVANNEANINAVVSNATNINAVNSNKTNINAVAGSISDVNSVAGNLSSINNVLDNMTAITTANSNSTNINTVASNISNVNTVASNSANISAVVSNATNINTVATNISTIEGLADAAPTLAAVGNNLTDITTVATELNGDNDIGTVATNISDINDVGDNIDSVLAVAGNTTNINAVNTNKTNIDTVASNVSSVTGVANNITSINSVSDNLVNISAVNNNKTNINTVATNISNVNSVGSNISNVNAVAGNATNINAVNSNKTNIDTVASNISDVVTVSGDIANVNTVANNQSSIDAVAGNASNINSVNANKSNIDTVATNSTNINSVASNLSNINTVASSASNIETVATNIPVINNVNTNMSEISNVNNHMSDIQGAVTAADDAETWAEGTDVQVVALGGTHSSKGWTTQAQNYAVAANSSSISASNYAASAASSATAASGYATDALNNSQKLMKSINPALCWSRQYTDYDMEKKYQFITCNQNGSYIPTIDSNVFTTEDDIQGDGYIANDTLNFSLIFVGDRGYYSKKGGGIINLGDQGGGHISETTIDKIMVQNSGSSTSYSAQFLDKNGSLQIISYNSLLYRMPLSGTFNSGWTMAYYPIFRYSEGYYGFGIKDGKLYTIINTESSTSPYDAFYEATLLDESGQWTYATGTYKSGESYSGIGIKDGKLYAMTNSTVTLIDDVYTWSTDMFIGQQASIINYNGSNFIYVINNGKLFAISPSSATIINNSITFARNNRNYAITNDGKLYQAGYNTLQGHILLQQGTDTDWVDIRINYPGYGIIAIKNGDIVYGGSYNSLTNLTNEGGYVRITGGPGYQGAINTMVAWKQTPVLKTEYVYTTPTSTTGNYLYGSTSLANPRAIVSISSLAVSDSTNTYTRDSDNDSYFAGRPDTFVSTALTTGDLVDALSS